MTDRRRLSAYHEAGHAVARLVSGNPVRSVAIAEDGAGSTHYLYRTPRPMVDAVCCLAGPTVEAAISNRPLAKVLFGTTDLDMALMALRQDTSRTGLRTAVHLATFLVREHTAAIDAVAQALLTRGALDGVALAAIMRAAS
jgi:hypothetical protein